MGYERAPAPRGARFNGTCCRCRGPIKQNDPIGFKPGEGAYCIPTCYVARWGEDARRQIGQRPERRVDPIDRPIVPDERGRIDLRPGKAPAPDAPSPATPQRRPRTYAELFPEDD